MSHEPTYKSPQIEEQLKTLFGYDRRESIRSDKCVPPPIGCGKPIEGFRDALSEKEYRISGLCQNCQDEVFGVDDDEL